MFAARSVERAAAAMEDAPPPAAMDDCIRRPEEEKGKIEVFRRELPLCARLLADVIDVMKKDVEEKKGRGGGGGDEEDGGAGDKSSLMSTAQLWTGGSKVDEVGRSSSEAFAEALTERVESAVGEVFSIAGQWQSEQQK